MVLLPSPLGEGVGVRVFTARQAPTLTLPQGWRELEYERSHSKNVEIVLKLDGRRHMVPVLHGRDKEHLAGGLDAALGQLRQTREYLDIGQLA